ncbi:Hsp70 family protein [Talaromyces proteolyticus]|uniref:Hsp70 family protein n=1 Tax=Talaromyces proteolyticus TaxID=1131652 RepID=A0AAD4KXS5_9EURO|nr:Hsp70 family protein [Talaromyces proteolyticus]KAH8702220.1 Hsp70 family protein [Talaromyces proteolyticus]
MSLGNINYKLDSLSLASTKKKIIVAVDYGTTFTGAAYVNSSSDVNIINIWPGTGRDTDHVWKTPSCIAYPDENKSLGKRKWGFQVEPGHKCYSWTKLLLDKNAPLTKYDDPMLEKATKSGIMQLPPGKDAVGVVADFLTSVYEHIMHILEKGLAEEILGMSAIEFWFTMPAIWSDKAQAATREAAKRAGFGPRPERPLDTIYMITEPEAAAIAALTRSTTDIVSVPVKSGDGVLVCDCGGGTVDITTYLISETKPRLSFEELCTGTGGKCGSTALDRNFYKLMSERFGTAFDALPAKRIGPGSAFMRRFEALKRNFGLDTEDTTYELPLNIRSSQVAPEYYDEEEGSVIVSDQDLRDVFDPVVDQIIRLIKTQMQDANKEMETGTINRIILVGGFGDSEYLRQAVKKTFGSEKKLTITIPNNPQSAIVHGAALRGLHGIQSTARRCRRHYGFSWGIYFREGIDDEKNSYWDEYYDAKMVRGITKWMINKGQKYHQDYSKLVSISHTHWPSNSLKKSTELYSCDLVDAPERIENPSVKYIGTIDVDFTKVDLTGFDSKIISGRRVYMLSYSLKVIFGAQEGILKFKAISKGKVVGKSEISFASGSYY